MFVVFTKGKYIMLRQLATIACAWAFTLYVPAQAAVIDFADVGSVACTLSPITSGGFTFTGNDFYQCVYGPQDDTQNANNGTSILVEGSSVLEVKDATSAPFSAFSVDLGTSFFADASPNRITVTGLLVGGGQVSQSLTVTDRFQTFALSGFEDLKSLRFGALEVLSTGGITGYYALDNLVVEPMVPPPSNVPTPPTLALSALALLALAARRRQR